MDLPASIVMEEELKRLRVQRALCKGTITRIDIYVSDKCNMDMATFEEVEVRKNRLQLAMEKYESFQVAILTIDPNDSDSMETVEEKYYSVLAKLDTAIARLKKSLEAKPLQDCQISQPSSTTSKLPNIEIPVFSGKDFTKYAPFRDLFLAVFDTNKTLSDVQKLFYLKKYLSDDALAVIDGLPLVNESYAESLKLLKKRFDNKARLISNHINILLELPTMQRGTAGSIRGLITEVQQQLYALKNLNQPIEHWDMLLINILTKKLDPYTNRAFQLDRDRNSETLPTIDEFISYLENRAVGLEESGDKIAPESISRKIVKVTNVATKSPSSKVCKQCNGNHSLFDCTKFKMAAVEDRIKFIDNHKLCTICLNDHKGRCRFHFKCKICKMGHNTLLHSDGIAEQEQAVVLHTNSSSYQVLLPTVRVKLTDSRGRHLFVRALLDSGSQASFITTSMMEELSLVPMNQTTNIIGIGNKDSLVEKYVNVNIQSPVQGITLEAKCNVVDRITTHLPQQQIDISDFTLPKGITLADPDFNVPDQISLLLGADIYFNIIRDGQMRLGNGTVLQNTLFGYVVGGSVAVPVKENQMLVSNHVICEPEKLENIMEGFWMSEKVPEETKSCNEFQKAEQVFVESVELRENIFFVDMPLKTDIDNLQLGDSFSAALQRFLALERKFKKDSKCYELYKQFINEYIALGHAKKVDISTYDIINGPVYFLPHHAVLNESSKTTKLRVVFNGSMKSKNRVSLNDVMLNGAVVQSELFDILILFRTYICTLICDITKMFRGVYINEKQTSLQNILWRDHSGQPISCLQLQTVTYGLKASCFLATRCLIELADRFGAQYPLAAQAMRFNTYVDDVLAGTDDFNQLTELKEQLEGLLSKASFVLHKWCSNVPQVLDDLPNEHKYFEEIDINKDNIIKTLGLKYDIMPDQFTFTSPVSDPKELQTKRQILSYIGKMFDPLGLVGPIIVIAKMFMQELWSLQIGWDNMLPQTQLEKWNKFLEKLALMGRLTVSRCLYAKNCTNIELVGYADASLKAFGCCLYLRVFRHSKGVVDELPVGGASGIDSERGSLVKCGLLCSKSRVAPIGRSLTIPRLELNSALLLSQLVARVYNSLKNRFPLTVYLYSDSQIVLAWLNSQKICDVYVSRRVKQINELTKQFQWAYVKSADNPADLLSRGCDPQKLKLNNLWWCGPHFLSNIDFTHIPERFEFSIPSVDEDEVANNVCTTDVIDNAFYEKYSNLNKLQRIVALLLRFKHNCLHKNEKVVEHLLPSELNTSLNVIIRHYQLKHFNPEIKSLINGGKIKSGIANLHPFLDEQNILRVGGRLQNASNMSYEKKHPAIIPKSSYLASLLVEREHRRLLHAGPKLVLSSLSQKLYLVSGIREVKKVVHRCIRCHRVKATVVKQLMGSLPKERITADRPFQTVGVDYCGPFNIKVARIRKPIVMKAYVALYVCFITKAIHVELVSDMTTEAFLASLKRFIARRGLPSTIFSDNAKNFRGANNTLKGLYDLFNSKKHKDDVIEFCTTNCIKFKFIPSYSPEFGGLWEAGVKSLKHHLKRVVGSLCLTFEGLNTVITEIEAILNSRPLLPMSSDISDTNYLTPGHFLIGTAMTSYPEVDLSTDNINRLKFWNILTKLKQDFWKSWSKDYLTQLQSRPKWKDLHSNIKEGDLVIVRSDDTAPLQWPMARVVKIFNGPDGNVRVAELKIGNKIYKRSYRKLSLLPIDS